MATRAVKAWAIRHWNDPTFYVETVRRTRREAWEAFEDAFAMDRSEVDYDRKHGIHRATVVEIKRVAS